MKIILSFAATALLSAFDTPTLASDAPAGLRNKTLSLSWGLTTSWRRLSDNKTGSSNFTMGSDI